MTQVGTWNINLPTSATPTKRERDGAPAGLQTNEHRLAGAPAFIKPNMNRDDFDISFPICDAKSSSANAKYVHLNPGWTWQQARAEAMLHWDESECQRVIDYNTRLAVYWARSRLLRSLWATPQNRKVGACRSDSEVTINTDELVRLVTCADKMKEMVTLVDESNRIVQARLIEKRRLADMA